MSNYRGALSELSPSDRADIESFREAPPADPADWNARIHATNGSPLAQPLPVDRVFYAITQEAQAVEVAFCDQTLFWTGAEVWSRVDGESGSWSADEIVGWSDDYEDAQEAARLLAQAEGR